MMIYTLHHSTGTLLMSAEDRSQVIEWSKRQLGHRSNKISISECFRTEAGNSVEKDGTGITAREAAGCRPIVSVMANTAQDVLMEHGSSGRHDDPTMLDRWRLKETTWH